MTRILLTPCILTTNKLEAGYGRCWVIRYGRRIRRTHVRAWIEANGRLPAEGMQINHHCDNPPCVNPEHLYEGTQLQNMRDASARIRFPNQTVTQCPKGHEYTFENTYRPPNGQRVCKICARDWDKSYKDRNRDELRRRGREAKRRARARNR